MVLKQAYGILLPSQNLGIDIDGYLFINQVIFLDQGFNFHRALKSLHVIKHQLIIIASCESLIIVA